MTPKTLLEIDAIAEILAPLDLRPRRVRAVEAGTINSNYRVDTDGGVVFLRVNEGKSEAEVRYEASLLWHLGVRRFPTPQPVRRADGTPFERWQGKLVTVFPWVSGHHVDEQGIAPAHCRAVGVALAELHAATGDFGERREGRYTFARIRERIESMREEPRVAEVLPILDEEVAFLDEARAPSLPTGIIHGDVFPDNVLWAQGEIAAVLDFEQASDGRLAYDLVVALCAWCWSGADFDDARAHALCAGYQAVRPLEEDERAAFVVEARFAALRFTVTRLTDVFLPGVELAGKDWRDYLARLEALRALAPERAAAWLVAGDGEGATSSDSTAA